MLKTAFAAIALATALSATAIAEQAKPQDPGKSEYAPGQKAKEPNAGPAKEYAPGQQMKEYNDPNKPGASEYAPGHQEKSNTTPRPKS